MSVICRVCDQSLPVPPLSPLTVKTDAEGKQFIPSDYTQVYEHMKTHPEAWNDDLAQEYEQWKKGEL